MSTYSEPLLVFDFRGVAGEPHPVCFTRPLEVVCAHSVEEVRPALRAIQQATGAGLYAAGYVAYEAAPAFDPALVVHAGATVPLLWFGLFQRPTEIHTPRAAGAFRLSGWKSSVNRAAYVDRVGIVRDAIERGLTYQVNYTIRLRAEFEGDDFALYRRLRESQDGGYAAYIDTGRFKILSASPELFFRLDDSEIITRPMKGTARRGRDGAEDDRLYEWLKNSEKNRTENIMIVDLLRNDLGRIAETGSVRVPDLFQVERYPTVYQMTSTVAARLRRGVGLDEVFAALFPCGSVTGAPKVSTMKIIEEIEDSPRNTYCGAIGMVAPGGKAIFNVAIRTVLLDTETGIAEYGAGGGITWDSDAGEEYSEVLDKAAILTAGQTHTPGHTS